MRNLRKLLSALIVAVMLISSLGAFAEEGAATWTEETTADGWIMVTQENGPTLGYSSDSGVTILEVDGQAFKDLDRDGELDVYEDWRLSDDERAEDLASRLDYETISGLMMYMDLVAMNSDATNATASLGVPTAEVDLNAPEGDLVNYVLPTGQRTFISRFFTIPALQQARLNNNIQAVVESMDYGIPIMLTTDPRSAYADGASSLAIHAAEGDTAFEKTIENFSDDGDSISFTINIENTGDVAGKDVVQIYYTPPYTNGGIEKASANLVDFAKTSLIEPGNSEKIYFSIAKEDMAAYDSEGVKLENGGYILEAGEYTISVRSDSHTVDDERAFTVEADVDYSENARPSDETAAVNQFQDYARGTFEQLSRADGFANYEETCGRVLAETDYEMDEETLAAVEANVMGGYDSTLYDNPEDEMPTMGADNGVVLADMTGLDYDDPLWDGLLDELSFSDMEQLVNAGGWQTAEISSIEKRATSDCDGPAGLNNYITGSYGTTYPSEVLMAQTWSKDMAFEIGASMGSEFAAAENYGWYGPAMNIHRSAFAGRNFEYFSEDGVLSGLMAVNEANGAAQFGVYPYLKHFALNDQELGRTAILLTYASEQAIREIYLRPFEIAVKGFEGGALAMMTSYNWIGDVPAMANSDLLNDVLRGEWGFEGMVITDYFGSYGYMISDNCLRNGNDLMLGYGSYESNELDSSSATLVNAMRQASKNILYTVANSGYYAGEEPTETVNRMDELFRTLNIAAGAVLGALEIALLCQLVYQAHKRRKAKP